MELTYDYRKVLVRTVGFTGFWLLGALANNRELCKMTTRIAVKYVEAVNDKEAQE